MYILSNFCFVLLIELFPKGAYDLIRGLERLPAIISISNILLLNLSSKTYWWLVNLSVFAVDVRSSNFVVSVISFGIFLYFIRCFRFYSNWHVFSKERLNFCSGCMCLFLYRILGSNILICVLKISWSQFSRTCQ